MPSERSSQLKAIDGHVATRRTGLRHTAFYECGADGDPDMVLVDQSADVILEGGPGGRAV